jgi:hypothetical protein
MEHQMLVKMIMKNLFSFRYTQKAMRHGGEVVDYELAGLVFDMYKLYQKLNMELE